MNAPIVTPTSASVNWASVRQTVAYCRRYYGPFADSLPGDIRYLQAIRFIRRRFPQLGSEQVEALLLGQRPAILEKLGVR